MHPATLHAEYLKSFSTKLYRIPGAKHITSDRLTQNNLRCTKSAFKNSKIVSATDQLR
jgi:hypothetical protein